MSTSSPTVLPATLRRDWWSVALTFALAAAATYGVLYLLWRPSHALEWGIPTSAALIYVLGYARVNLRYNRRADGQPILPSLGICNALTLVRGLLVGLLAGFVVVPLPSGIWAFVPGLLYTAAAITDLADGYLARTRGESTRLGAKLDVEMDSFGILVAVLLAVQAGQLPGPFMALGGLYYVYRIGLSLRRRMGKTVHPLPESRLRKRIGGAWVIFLCIILYPVFTPPATTLAGVVLGGLLLASFARDAFVACGARTDVAPPSFTPAEQTLHRWGVPLRVIAAGAALYIAGSDASSLLGAEGAAFAHVLWVGLALWLLLGKMEVVAVSLTIAASSWVLTTGGWSVAPAVCATAALLHVVLGPRQAPAASAAPPRTTA